MGEVLHHEAHRAVGCRDESASLEAGFHRWNRRPYNCKRALRIPNCGEEPTVLDQSLLPEGCDLTEPEDLLSVPHEQMAPSVSQFCGETGNIVRSQIGAFNRSIAEPGRIVVEYRCRLSPQDETRARQGDFGAKSRNRTNGGGRFAIRGHDDLQQLAAASSRTCKESRRAVIQPPEHRADVDLQVGSWNGIPFAGAQPQRAAGERYDVSLSGFRGRSLDRQRGTGEGQDV